MLNELRISNLAVVEDTILNFSGGMNVLTGETGAGKSIIISAVSLLSGSRADRSLIRKGADHLSIEGIFTVDEEWQHRDYLGMERDENRLSIKRRINSDGRSRIWINGTSSTNRVARKLTGSLFELHGQHRQQDILDPETHIDYLDGRGNYGELLSECREAVIEYRRVRDSLLALKKEEKENRERRDFLEFQYRELNKMKLEPGLKDELESRINRGKNIHRYQSALANIREIFEGSSGGALDSLSKALSQFDELASIDRAWEGSRSRVEGVIAELNDLASVVDISIDENGDEGEDIERLQERIAAIQGAERKFGKEYSELIEYRDSLGRILRELDDGSDRIAEAGWQLERSAEKLKPILVKLTEKRRETAAKLDSEMSTELRGLGIEGALFRTELDKIEIKSLSSVDDELVLPLKGWDKVEFNLRTNIGEDIKPLRDIVSGGELSRVTLVLRSRMAKERGVPTLIFDEIDTGLGADMGSRISDKMLDLSGDYQVICITHIPQIAAGAERHIAVRKNIKNERTVSFAVELGERERVDEVSRMLGESDELSRRMASQMIRRKCARSSVG